MTIKSTKLAFALLSALTVAAPLALTTPVEAAPFHNAGGGMMGGAHNDRGHVDAFHDRNHSPPMKVEYRPRQPHGHYRWHNGGWNWSHNQWAWAPGLWIRF